MSTSSFKVKNGLTLTPVDLSTLVDPQSGDIACDINDNNKVKRFDEIISDWVELGAGGTDISVLYQEIFETGLPADYVVYEDAPGDVAVSGVNPLGDSYSLVIAQGDNGFDVATLDVPLLFRGQEVECSFYYESDLSEFFIYVDAGASFVTVVSATMGSTAGGVKLFSRKFIIPADATTLSWGMGTSSTATGTQAKIDNIQLKLTGDQAKSFQDTRIVSSIDFTNDFKRVDFTTFTSASLSTDTPYNDGNTSLVLDHSLASQVTLPIDIAKSFRGKPLEITLDVYATTGTADTELSIDDVTNSLFPFSATQLNVSVNNTVRNTFRFSLADTCEQIAINLSSLSAGANFTYIKSIVISEVDVKTTIGSGTALDAVILADVGNGDGNNPIIKYSVADTTWQFSNDGTTFSDFGSGGGSGPGDLDVMFQQDFDSAVSGDFGGLTNTTLDTVSPLHGTVSAKMDHGAAMALFDQIFDVDPKFRGKSMLMTFDVESNASADNVVVWVYDNTNAAYLLNNESVQLISDSDVTKNTFSFTIPEDCLEINYGFDALTEASAITYIDDVVFRVGATALLETSIDVPVITDWQSYTPTFTGFGTVTSPECQWRRNGENVEIRAKFTTGTCTAVEARVSLPNGYTSASTARIPSLQQIGNAFIAYSNTAGFINSAGVLIEPNVTYVTFQASTTATLSKGNASAIASSLHAVSFFASVPVTGLTATESVTIPLTQSGIQQDADFELKAAGNAAQVITASVTNIPFIVTSSRGSSATWNGSQLTIINEGVYTLSGTVNWTTSTTRRLALYVDGVDAGQGGSYDISVGEFAFTRYFTAGQVVSLRDVVAGTLSNSTTTHHISITHQGSLKIASVNSNSKITIPTSELRFEGASSRGATDTAIVKFDTLAKIRGDAFTVVNTAANGTVITMKKAGKLDIGASIFSSTAGQQIQITKNQIVLVGLTSTSSEILGQEYSPGASDILSVSYSGSVNVGDVIRLAANVIPSVYSGNQLNLFFQEQSVQVSVSNTLPQFSESDSCVRVDTANGFGSTGTMIRRFSNVRQNLGTDIEYTDSATNGASFRVMTAGKYEISYTDYPTGVASIGLTLNSSLLSTALGTIGTNANNEALALATNAAGYFTTASWSGELQAGDIIRPHTNGSAASNNNAIKFTMSKVGRPNVTGVDVTPFVNIPQPEISEVRVENCSSRGSTATYIVKYDTITKSVNNGGFSIENSATLGTYITVLKSGVIDIQAAAYQSAADSSVYITKNQANLTVIPTNSEIMARAYSQGITNLELNWSGQVTKGDVIRIGASSTPSAAIGNNLNVVMTCPSDQILTPPETFSSDTAAFTYAGSATYTLATLVNAPVGTYITYTYAASGNVRTQTTTRPTQTDASMNSDGFLLYTRAYNAASTAANPSIIQIQIGKGLKGRTLDLYKTAGKVTPGSLDVWGSSGGTFRTGVHYKEYDEKTGVLTVDAGYNFTGSVTSAAFDFTDTTNATSGYLVINASKNPALTGMNVNRVAARGVQSSGQSFTTGSTTVVTWDAAKTYDTHGALNAATGVFTAPETGFYQVNSSLTVVDAAIATHSMYIYKNSAVLSQTNLVTPITNASYSSSISDTVYLAKNDTLDIRFSQNSGASRATSGSATQNFFSIVKAGN